MHRWIVQSVLIGIVFHRVARSLPVLNFTDHVLTNRMIMALSDALASRDRQPSPTWHQINRQQQQAPSATIHREYPEQLHSFYPAETAEQQQTFYSQWNPPEQEQPASVYPTQLIDQQVQPFYPTQFIEHDRRPSGVFHPQQSVDVQQQQLGQHPTEQKGDRSQ
jgi:hypothetical protein